MTLIPTDFVTTAIAYVNGPPHIGHAQEYVLADAIVRHRRRAGSRVRFQSGTDDNSLKTLRAADAAGTTPRALVAHNAIGFEQLARTLRVGFDDFLKTSSDVRHAPAVQKLWRACADAGDIYRRRYSGLYCVGCEQFFADGELPDNLCPEHAAALEHVEEENYFFRASRYGARIRQLIADDTLRIRPETRKHEILGFLARGLNDFSISRSRARARGWGIEVPGDPEQVVYVWFDALANYISGLGYATGDAAFDRGWQRARRRTHVIGKGILRFHAAYWPAILLSAGLALPSELLVHGYVTVDGRKISKSSGTAADVFDVIHAHGPDAFRYYVLRQLHTTQDADFSGPRLKALRNAELADQLGNLVRRTLTLVEKRCDGRIPACGPLSAADRELLASGERAAVAQIEAFEAFDLNAAAAAAIVFVTAANRYIDAQAPWSSALESTRVHTVLHVLLDALRHAAWLFQPLIPDSSARIEQQLGGPSRDATSGQLCAGTPIALGAALFPK
jgi:methionyl-tRNA synthetase